MTNYRTQFDPQGRMNWGPAPTEFPSAWWWDTSAFPIIELKVHTGQSQNPYVAVGTYDVSNPAAGFQLTGASGGGGAASPAIVTYLGGAVWQHDDRAGTVVTLDLNTAVGDLTASGITALKVALTYAAAEVSAVPPPNFAGTTVQALINELAARHSVPTTLALPGTTSLSAAHQQVVAFDSSAGAVVINLPTGAADGDVIKVYAVAGLDVLSVGAALPNPLTLTSGPSDSLDGLSASETLTEMVNHFHLRFDQAAATWQLGL